MTLPLCECGCGKPVRIATKTQASKGLVRGKPTLFALGHYANRGVDKLGKQRKAVVASYREITISRRQVRLHRVRAERALGKPLPPRAVVHHADGSKSDNAPLVICQDTAYHCLLHKRMRIVRAGGNPDTESWCSGCKAPRPISKFWKHSQRGLQSKCKQCCIIGGAVRCLRVKRRSPCRS